MLCAPAPRGERNLRLRWVLLVIGIGLNPLANVQHQVLLNPLALYQPLWLLLWLLHPCSHGANLCHLVTQRILLPLSSKSLCQSHEENPPSPFPLSLGLGHDQLKLQYSAFILHLDMKPLKNYCLKLHKYVFRNYIKFSESISDILYLLSGQPPVNNAQWDTVLFHHTRGEEVLSWDCLQDWSPSDSSDGGCHRARMSACCLNRLYIIIV